LHRIYLDTNVYCRPRDDRLQKRIDRQAKAFEEIAGLREERKVIIVSSDYVKMELGEIENEEKRKDMTNFERVLCDLNFEHGNDSKDLVMELMKECNVRLLDALHISATVLTEAKFFLTCDDEVIKKRTCIEKVLSHGKYHIIIADPVDYLISEWRIKID
jgi:hypothetical protein